MKQILLFALCLINAHTYSQCYIPFIPLDCYVDTTSNLEDAYNLSRNRKISAWGWEHATRDNHDKKTAILRNEKYEHQLNKLYHEACEVVMAEFGSHFCERIGAVDISFNWRLHDRLAGSIRFGYSKKKIDCWNNYGSSLSFHFMEDKNGQLHFDELPFFPDCMDEDCGYMYPTLHAMLTDHLGEDIFENFDDLRKTQVTSQATALWKSGFWRKNSGCTLNIKDGSIVDTVPTFSSRLSLWRKPMSKAEAVDSSTLIVDAICIKVAPGEGRQGELYKVYHYLVLTIFKGNPLVDTFLILNFEGTLHDRALPKPGERAVFFLNKRTTSERDKILVPKTDKLYSIVYGPFWVKTGSLLYSKVYPELEVLTGKKAFIIFEPHYKSALFSSFLNPDSDAEKPSIGEGVILQLDGLALHPKAREVVGNLVANAVVDLSYLFSFPIYLQYDTMLIAPYAASKELFSVQHQLKESLLKEKCDIPYLNINDGYETRIEDFSANTIRVSFVYGDTSKPARELGPINLSNHNYYNSSSVLFNFTFVTKAIDQLVPTQKYALKLLKDEMNRDLPHYLDRYSGVQKSFDYVKVENRRLGNVSLSYLQPTIISIEPNTYAIGDTITIKGTNLAKHQKEVYCPCEIVDKGIYFKHHCKLDEAQIIYSDYSELKIVIPPTYNYKDEFKDMLPADGTIKIRYPQSSEELQYLH